MRFAGLEGEVEPVEGRDAGIGEDPLGHGAGNAVLDQLVHQVTPAVEVGGRRRTSGPDEALPGNQERPNDPSTSHDSPSGFFWRYASSGAPPALRRAVRTP